MVYFYNLAESLKLLRRNWQILIPSLYALLLTLLFAFFFIYINDLFSLIFRDPSELFVAGGLSTIAKRISSVLVTNSYLLKIVVSFVGFVFVNFLAGSSLIATRFVMINETEKGKKINAFRAFLKGSSFYWRVIEMRVMVFILILVFSAVLSLPLFLITKFSAVNALLISLSVILIILVMRLLLLFRYPVLFKENIRTIPSLIKSIDIVKDKFRYSSFTWFIIIAMIFLASLMFEFLKIFVNDSFYGLAALSIVMIILYFFKEIFMAILNTFIDVFSFVSYLKVRK